MSEEFSGDPTSQTSAPSPEGVVSIGPRLKDAREARNLSQADIALQLKVSVRKLEAIETEQWDQLPSGPYLRGLVRSYAKAVGLESGATLSLIERHIGSGAPTAIFAMPNDLRAPFPQRPLGHSESRAGRLLIIAGFLCALIAGLIFWSGTDSFRRAEAVMAQTFSSTHSRAASDATDGAPAGSVSAGQENGRDAATGSSGDPIAVTPSVNDAHTADPMHGAVAAAPAGAAGAGSTNAVKLHFSEDSWVEVRQADGTTLFSQLNLAGSDQSIEGKPPLEMVIGNAPGVTVTYRDAPIDLTAHTHDRVARFTLPLP